MKRKFYPDSSRDRINFWMWVVNGLFFALAWYTDNIWLMALNGTACVLLLFVTYAVQDEPPEGASNEYSAVMAQIGEIEKNLSNLSAFLGRERQRVEYTEKTVKQLEEEKTKLEPIVLTQKETVEAILTAHAKRASSNIWKERLIGFVLGMFASMAAAIIYDYFKG